MLKIDVVSYQGKPIASPITAVFNRAGGAIGRNPDCYLALPDPMRHLSRQHAQINWCDNGYLIENTTGNNFVIVNGHTLHANEFCALQQGQQIYIGHYLLEVAALDSGPGAVPDAGVPAVAAPIPIEPKGQEKSFFESLQSSAFGAQEPDAAPPVNGPDTASIIAAGDDFSIHPSNNPFAVLETKSGAIGSADPLIHPEDLNLAQIEPERRAEENDDPFDMPSLDQRNAADPLFVESSKISLSELLGQSQNIDELYSDSTPSLSGLDPLAELEPVRALGPFEAQKSLDPLALFAGDGGEVQSFLDMPSGTVMDDHSDQLVMHLDLPRAMVVAPAPESQPVAVTDKLEDASEAAVAAPLPISDEAPQAPAVTASVPPPAATAPQPIQGRRAADSAPMTPDEHQVLIQAFLNSAGLPKEMVPQRLTPEFMETVGAMLFTAMQGTVDLIAARAATKREVKAEMTLILPVHNNPLKFVPDGQAALIHMFGKQIPGFLSPIDAMRDAYQDLRAHQVGIFAGMRAALAEVLQRFSPADVEKRLEQLSMIDSLMPGHRKAKLWDLYGQQFKKIYAEAEEDFDVIFGDAFAVAYEEQTRSMREDLASSGQ